MHQAEALAEALKLYKQALSSALGVSPIKRECVCEVTLLLPAYLFD